MQKLRFYVENCANKRLRKRKKCMNRLFAVEEVNNLLKDYNCTKHWIQRVLAFRSTFVWEVMEEFLVKRIQILSC